MRLKPTLEEKRAIDALKRLEKHWPKSLWLYSASGTLCVMRRDDQGNQAMLPGVGGGVDKAYKVDEIAIPNDGGDW